MAVINRVTIAGVVVCGLVLGCSKSPTKPPQTSALVLIGTHALTITEPSGLTMHDSTFWTVSNNPDFVYQLDATGRTVRRLNYQGGDLEGITYDASDRTLWVCEENRREVVHLDLNGDILARKRLSLTGPDNSGLEGICLDGGGRMFVVNEKDPGLFIALNPDHSIATEQTLSFARDYSDIACSRNADTFWIVSDQSRALYQWNKLTGIMHEYPLAFPKPEGLCVDEAANRVYVVSDSTHTLYEYQIQ